MASLVAMRCDATLGESDGELILDRFENADPIFGFYDLEPLRDLDVLGFEDESIYEIEAMVQEILSNSGELDSSHSSVRIMNELLVAKVSPTGHAEIVQVLEALAKLDK